jgi:hypothetical protein
MILRWSKKPGLRTRGSVLINGPWATGTLGLASLALLVLACFGTVIFGGGQFAFRDATRFYYPLYYRIQENWSTGHLPLWEPGENGGKPVLGNAMAAVLYPGKLLFALLPYAWGMRFYIVAHELLAFGTMLALARSWGISLTGAVLAGLCYAFGGPVLSNYFNVIYLVGAAWLPLGIKAVDCWLRLGRRSALFELALVLSMQILGGDPEAAYLTVACAFGYAGALANHRGTSSWWWRWGLAIPAGAIAWVWLGPRLTSMLHGSGARAGQSILAAAWTIGTLAYVFSRSREHRLRLTTSLLGLAGASLLAATLTAVQVLPAIDNIGTSVRWSGTVPVYLYELSVLPYRAFECIWPNVFGTFTSGNRYWMTLLPPAGAHQPSSLTLYLGTLPLILALGAAGFRNGPAWRGGLTALAILSFWASLGEFAGPSRWSAANPSPTVGDETFYGLLSAFLPGLHLFRFPYKLLVFSNLALAALAGLGWDRILAGVNRRRVGAMTMGLLGLTVVALAVSVAWRERLIALLAASPESSSIVFGPLDARGAVGELIRGLSHGAIALVCSLALIVWSKRSPIWAGLFAIPFVAFDLAWANCGWVVSVPQRDFEQVPAVLKAIGAAERTEPDSGPFRVHRMSPWVPIGWSSTTSLARLRELVDWEIDTLQPGLGLLHGMSYVLNDESETGRADYREFFEPAYRTVNGQDARALGLQAGQPIVYYPRQAFDLWGARYFILPSFPAGWTSGNRGYAAFLDQTELIYPEPAFLAGPDHLEDRESWLKTKDVQVRRNKVAFPRAWIVHEARLIRPHSTSDPRARDALRARLGFARDSSQADPLVPAPDLRSLAYIETDDPKGLTSYLPGVHANQAESVTVRYGSPTRVVLEARLSEPGLVVLADIFDRGWRLAVDAQPATILRANLLMRAAAVDAGVHRLVYTYEPVSVRVGACLSLAGLAALLALGAWARWGPRHTPGIIGAQPGRFAGHRPARYW